MLTWDFGTSYFYCCLTQPTAHTTRCDGEDTCTHAASLVSCMGQKASIPSHARMERNIENALNAICNLVPPLEFRDVHRFFFSMTCKLLVHFRQRMGEQDVDGAHRRAARREEPREIYTWDVTTVGDLASAMYIQETLASQPPADTHEPMTRPVLLFFTTSALSSPAASRPCAGAFVGGLLDDSEPGKPTENGREDGN